MKSKISNYTNGQSPTLIANQTIVNSAKQSIPPFVLVVPKEHMMVNSVKVYFGSTLLTESR